MEIKKGLLGKTDKLFFTGKSYAYQLIEDIKSNGGVKMENFLKIISF